MDAKANSAHRAVTGEPVFPRRRRRSGDRCVALTLLATFGVIAFIFSAVSPDDDDIQQVFYKTSESKQCVVAGYKTVSSLRIFRICRIHVALAPSAQQSFRHFAMTRVSVPGDQIRRRVSSGRTGDRSPPTRIFKPARKLLQSSRQAREINPSSAHVNL